MLKIMMRVAATFIVIIIRFPSLTVELRLRAPLRERASAPLQSTTGLLYMAMGGLLWIANKATAQKFPAASFTHSPFVLSGNDAEDSDDHHHIIHHQQTATKQSMHYSSQTSK